MGGKKGGSVPMRAVVERERSALKATVDPMLMSDMTMVKLQVKMIEFTGMCHVSWTWLRWEMVRSGFGMACSEQGLGG